MPDTMRAILAAALIVTGCAPPSFHGINRAYFSEHKSRRILVMQFEGNEDLVEDSTNHFIALLSDQSRLEIVRPEPEKVESGTIWDPLKKQWDIMKEEARGFPMSLLRRGPADKRAPLIERAREQARLKSANIIILGTVTSQGGNMGRNCTSTVRIYDAETGVQVANFFQRYDRMLTFTSRPVALKAVALTAADARALLE